MYVIVFNSQKGSLVLGCYVVHCLAKGETKVIMGVPI